MQQNTKLELLERVADSAREVEKNVDLPRSYRELHAALAALDALPAEGQATCPNCGVYCVEAARALADSGWRLPTNTAREVQIVRCPNGSCDEYSVTGHWQPCTCGCGTYIKPRAPSMRAAMKREGEG